MTILRGEQERTKCIYIYIEQLTYSKPHQITYTAACN